MGELLVRYEVQVNALSTVLLGAEAELKGTDFVMPLLQRAQETMKQVPLVVGVERGYLSLYEFAKTISPETLDRALAEIGRKVALQAGAPPPG